ncbi:MAG: PEP-CTERM sorting domain-containing protein [Armatimonadetes bacterium]|nr:PEP-CTERM sorting domain-containing protein [Armatimonadota bacterium]
MKKLLVGAVGLAALSLSSFASADMLDFEDITADQFGNPIPSEGFTFDFNAQGWSIATNGYTGAGRVQNGTSTLFLAGPRDFSNAQVMFSSDSGAPFSIQSFDSAVFTGSFATGSIEFVGSYVGGGITVQDFSITNQWQSFAMNGTFTNLQSVTVVDLDTHNFGDGPGFQLDNIAINGTVPEPASLAVLGLGALALVRRRRTSK